MSSLKILPSQLTYEELLEALEDAQDSEEITEHNEDIVPFLSHYGVNPGDQLVSKRLLYNLYKTYSKDPVERDYFIFRVGEFVSTKRAGGSQFFCLNQDNFAISQHIFKDLQEKRVNKTKSLTYQKHFQWFLEGREITRGLKWVEGFILYFIYKDFCKSRRVNPKLGYENFHKFLKLHFQYRRLKGNRSLWFKVDENTHGLLSDQEKNVIREARKKTRGDQKEKQPQADPTETK